MNSPDRQLKIIRKKVSITSVIFTLPLPPNLTSRGPMKNKFYMRHQEATPSTTIL